MRASEGTKTPHISTLVASTPGFDFAPRGEVAGRGSRCRCCGGFSWCEAEPAELHEGPMDTPMDTPWIPYDSINSLIFTHIQWN